MPFKDAFNKFVDKANSTYQQQTGKAPPIPFGSKPRPDGAPPTQSQAPASYWAPTFNPSVPISQHFHHETGQSGWGNNEAQNYTNHPQNSFFTPNGQLVLRAIANHSAPTQGEKFSSARLTSHQLLARQQGYLRVRVTAPCARGIWPAFWLLPSEPFKWPEDGEVDIFEAWNGDPTNHSCLHWGGYSGRENDKHRVIETQVPNLQDPRGMEYGFAWQQPEDGKGGKMVWYIDGKAVMKAEIPKGVRRIDGWRIIVNVAMGGDVCQGILPADGTYDFVVHEVRMMEGPPAGWEGFDREYRKAQKGHTMDI